MFICSKSIHELFSLKLQFKRNVTLKFSLRRMIFNTRVPMSEWATFSSAEGAGMLVIPPLSIENERIKVSREKQQYFNWR